MDGLALNHDISRFAGHHDEGQIGATGSRRTFEQTAYLAIIKFGFGLRKIVRD